MKSKMVSRQKDMVIKRQVSNRTFRRYFINLNRRNKGAPCDEDSINSQIRYLYFS